ncbi:MAG: RNA polymerase subunit sigma-70 [Desulfitobacteriaceae bacterium]|nr:RNA polymerase subunit sigma-70 [Desulfitobacteriaceae bacterium]MDD4346712.1 RNA polymerase subunit sigma-70 [Desulfitobacteriaceae bacterium]MDD4402281.1 RNA polymerase subunit sigma-70 [Desulfitobacteriaceae bacterium]
MTDTQRTQIKELRLAGYGYKKIAQALCLSVDTVKSYCGKNNLAGVMAGTPSSSVDGRTFCKQCGKELLQKPNQKALLFCSKECRQTWWNVPYCGYRRNHRQQTRLSTINAFLYTLRKQENLLTEFDEKLWCSLVDYATVYDKNDVRFTFKDGTEIQA